MTNGTGVTPTVDRAAGVRAGYIICTSPRSGSTLLCTMLADTRRAGQPWSYFHELQFMQEWADTWNLPSSNSTPIDPYDAAYIRATAAAGRGGTPVFGMRLQQSYLPLLMIMLRRTHPEPPTDTARLELAFGPLRYVHLMREDKVAQAVSMVKAKQTGLWHRHADGSERERSSPAAEPIYDAVAIGAEVRALNRADKAWQTWFEQQAIDPLRVSCEALAADPNTTMIHLCAALGIALPDHITIMPGTAKLADAISESWVERYRTEVSLVRRLR